MRFLDFCFAILVTGSILRFIDKGIFGDVEASSGQTRTIEVDSWRIEDLFGLIGEGLGMQTFSSVLGDEALIARNVVRTWLSGILGKRSLTGL